jgi:hypothetical protein
MPYTVTLISFLHLSHSTHTHTHTHIQTHTHTHTHKHTVPILQSCFLLLIFKLMFKGVSECMPTMGVLFFGLFNTFCYSPLPLYLLSAFSTHPYVLYLHILCYAILIMLSHFLFLSFFPQFHREVPLLQTCYTSEFLYDHACFCIYVFGTKTDKKTNGSE